MTSIVVVGAGPAGCAFAVTAARGGHDVVLLHDDRRGKAWAGEALPAGGGELVTSIFGPGVIESHHIAYGTTAAWGSDDLVTHDFMTHWSGHGWHLDRARFDSDLRACAQRAGVRVVAERLSSLKRSSGHWMINEQVRADLIVDASGRAGAVVGRLGVRSHRFDDQIALVATVADTGGEQVTTIESGATGWWYTAPLPLGKRVVALVTDTDLLNSDRAETFNATLADTIHMKKYIHPDHSNPVTMHPAGTVQRADLYGDGWIAVGDAATSFDPLSSQGLVTGMVMAAHAGRLVGTDLVGTDLAEWDRGYLDALTEHESLRTAMYSAEQRWPEAPFWSRRH